MKNIDLAAKYDSIYKDGAYAHFFTYNKYASEKLIIGAIPSWAGLDVSDIGCV